MKKALSRCIIVLILLGIITSYSISKSIRDEVEIVVRERRVENLEFSGLTLVFYIDIKNSSSTPLCELELSSELNS